MILFRNGKLDGFYKEYRYVLLIVYLLSNTCFLHAEVITDGSLGARVELSGKDFQIMPELGQQLGGNLFHSFQNFNLSADESATFSGANSVQNIIARVTGGQASTIDGTLRSTIPNADLYFLNPYGILFGKNAKLDLQGGFHASTADYLKLQDGGRFEARNPNNSLLSVAPVTAFGFLTDSPAAITTQSSKLSVPAEKTLSLIGGNLHLTSDISLTADNTQPIPPVIAESILAVEQGRINLVSLAGRGEVIPNDHDLTLQGAGGKITVENTLVELSGAGGGAAFIRAGQFFLDNSIISSNTFGAWNGQDIDVKTTEVTYINGINSEISVVTVSTNNTGNISIDTPYFEINSGAIFSGSAAEGDAGTIDIHAHDVVLNAGGSIGSGALAIGKSGDLTLNVTHKLSLIGYYPEFVFFHSQPFENNPSRIWSICLGFGQSGRIALNAQELNLDNGNIIANGFGEGRGGDIIINAKSVRLTTGGTIASNAYETAEAGNIKIQVAEELHLSGYSPVSSMAIGYEWGIVPSSIDTGTSGAEKGGNIEIQAHEIILTEGGMITARSIENIGEAGGITIEADTMRLTQGGTIATSAQQASGGTIQLVTTHLLHLHSGEITTSVIGGTGSGGNIIIEQPKFIILNQGQIKAQADAGQGGNIHIAAQHFVPSVDSLVSASSNLGIDGQITIDSPTEDVGNQVLNLATNFLNAAALFPRSCAARIADQNPSQFVRPFTLVLKPHVFGNVPEDAHPSHLQPHH